MRGRWHVSCAAPVLTLALSATSALAGGLAVREQSVYGQGDAYAGIAAGGAPSSMFWNPATLTQNGRLAVELDATWFQASSRQDGTNNLPAALGFTSGVPNSIVPVLIPAGYMSMQFNDRTWIGMSVNSPFGLPVGFQNPGWAGAFYGQSATLKTYNLTPSVAIKLADWISIGAGMQIQDAQVSLGVATGIAAPGVPNLALLHGSGWALGWTAGVTLTPTATTQIGLGYRSAIDQPINGIFNTGIIPALGTGQVSTTVKFPDSVSLGLRQGLTESLTALGTVEWTHWSRIGTSHVLTAGGAPALAPSGAVVNLPFEFRDGWFYSAGLEYVLAPAWTVRGGIGYELTPVTDQVRIPLLPDNNRTWFSGGLTNRVTPNLSLDVAYSFVSVKNTSINVVPGNPWFNTITYVGTANSSINLLSIGVRYRMPDPPAPVAAKG
jgi:long-chain fatty acid transport protein